MGPLVTVVIPVFNRAHSVLPTLLSVQEQSVRDFECLVVDDGSEDGHRLELVMRGVNDARFRYIRRDNGGGGAARNTGIDEARGAIVAFLDSDDRWLPEKLERDMGAGADKLVVFSPVLVERSGRICAIRPRRGPRSGEPISEYLTCHEGFVPTSTLSLPVELARRVRYDERIAFGQDTDFAVRLAAEGAAFQMYPSALAVMGDDESVQRISRRANWKPVLDWLDGVSPLITRRAYLAYRGWHVARLAAEAGRYGKALRFYGAAVMKGALPPRLAAKALAQILIPRFVYGRLRS